MHRSETSRQAALIESKKSSVDETKYSVCDRVALSPREFARSFGRSETWGYRQLYSGRVKAIQISGRLLIPKSEIDRLLAEAAPYNGDPARAPGAAREFYNSNKRGPQSHPST